MAIKISRPVEAPVVEQEVTLNTGTPIVLSDLAWAIPLVLGGVAPAPVEGDKGKPTPIHAAGVQIQAGIFDGGSVGSVLQITVSSLDSAGVTINPDALPPSTILGSFQVNLDQVLSNVNVPRP
jgi:hypothetical protein